MDTLKNVLVKDEAFYQRKKESIETLMKNRSVATLLEKNGLSSLFVEEHWIDFLNYVEDMELCQGCCGIEECKKNFPGYKRELMIEDKQAISVLKVCEYGAKLDEQRRVFSHISSNIPKDMLLTSFQDLNLDNQGNLVELVRRLIGDVKMLPKKGLYVFGDMGIGKTYALAAFCNMLAVNLKDCAFISMPQLIQDLKSYFNSDEDNGIAHLKEVPYLVLDDLGAETLSAWGRDEVLYNLLNDRMLRRLPTYFTSVYDLKSLEDHYRLNKSRDEEIKVKRLMERILALSNNFELIGKKFR